MQYLSLPYHAVIMLSHGNISYAVLAFMVFGIEAAKTQAVCLTCVTFWVYLIPLPATGMEHSRGDSSGLRYCPDLPCSWLILYRYLCLPWTLHDCHAPKVEH